MMLSDEELRAQGLERVPGGRVVRDVRYFDLHLTLNDIPESTPCPCGAPTQKEFLEFETKWKSFTIRADMVPGYGCTGCGLKLHDPRVFQQLLNRTEGIAREMGEITLAEHLKAEAATHLRFLELRQE